MKNAWLIFGVFFFIFNAEAQTTETKYGVITPENYSAEIDLIYKSIDGWDGRLDLYYNNKSDKTTPLVINIHGGAWMHGDKESQTGFGSFFKKGFAVANVEYRLGTVAPAPAAIEDVRCALIYLISNASKYNIDTKRIVMMGGSAGGHLALMAGLLQNDKRFDNGCKAPASVNIAAIIDKYGVSDLSGFGNGSWRNKSAETWLDTKKSNKSFLKSISPISYVGRDNPPVFIVHGDADPIVPYKQSVDLHRKLTDAGVATEFMTVKGGQHGKFQDADKSRLSHAIIDFLVKQEIVD